MARYNTFKYNTQKYGASVPANPILGPIMATLVDDYQVQVLLAGAWVDITSDIISPIRAAWGITGIKPSDRIASTGSMKFTLRNTALKYLPGSTTAHADWNKGTPCKFVIEYNGTTHTRFRGLIDSMKPVLPIGYDGTVAVTVLDWMDIAARSPVINPAIQTDKTGDQVVTALLPFAPIQPLSTSLSAGASVFPAVFDSIRSDSAVYGEMARVALSELGYIYLRKDPEHGETLVFEGRNTRHALRTATPIALSLALSGYLLKEDGDNLLTEAGDLLKLNESTTVAVENDIEEVTVRYGEHMINRMTVRAHPKRVDTVEQVLFKLDTPVKIASGQTLEITGRYIDPSGGGTQVNADDSLMVAPVATTDYLMNANSAGSGTNLTANLSVTVVYGSEGPSYTLRNTSSSIGWITKLQARGYGIYSYSPIEAVVEDGASVVQYGYQNDELYQQYQHDPAHGLLAAARVVEREASPRAILEKIMLNPNVSSEVLQLQLYADVGDLVQIKFDKLGIDGLYYIQAVEMEMKMGGVLRVIWTIIGTCSLISGLTLLSVDFAAGSQEGVNYGYVPGVFNIPARTMAVRVKPKSLTSVTLHIGGTHADSGGTLLYLGGSINLRALYYTNLFNVAPGAWYTIETIPLDAWSTIVMSHNPQTLADDPVFYINGVAATVIELLTPAGSLNEESGNLVIGNWKTVTHDYDRPFDGEIADFRVYDRILTAAEALAYHNGGTVTDGMVFQGPCVRTSELARFIDKSLAGKKLIDNMFGAVGVVNGNPTGHTAP